MLGEESIVEREYSQRVCFEWEDGNIDVYFEGLQDFNLYTEEDVNYEEVQDLVLEGVLLIHFDINGLEFREIEIFVHSEHTWVWEWMESEFGFTLWREVEEIQR